MIFRSESTICFTYRNVGTNPRRTSAPKLTALNMKTNTLLIAATILMSCGQKVNPPMTIDEDMSQTHMDDNQQKTHTILPNSIKLQLKDSAGTNIELENVLCHLKIYSDPLSWYNYSFIPTDPKGAFSLTKEQLIQNTELKHFYDASMPLNDSPVKFELSVHDPVLLSTLLLSMEAYLPLNWESVKAELMSRGGTAAQADSQRQGIEKKAKSDEQLLSVLKANNNDLLDASSVNARTSGLWISEGDFEYEIEVESR